MSGYYAAAVTGFFRLSWSDGFCAAHYKETCHVEKTVFSGVPGFVVGRLLLFVAQEKNMVRVVRVWSKEPACEAGRAKANNTGSNPVMHPKSLVSRDGAAPLS